MCQLMQKNITYSLQTCVDEKLTHFDQFQICNSNYQKLNKTNTECLLNVHDHKNVISELYQSTQEIEQNLTSDLNKCQFMKNNLTSSLQNVSMKNSRMLTNFNYVNLTTKNLM